MTHHGDHDRRHAHGHGDHHQTAWWKRAHKDWRTWVAVGLMLAGMVAYVLTLDESLRPWGPARPSVPIAP